MYIKQKSIFFGLNNTMITNTDDNHGPLSVHREACEFKLCDPQVLPLIIMIWQILSQWHIRQDSKWLFPMMKCQSFSQLLF